MLKPVIELAATVEGAAFRHFNYRDHNPLGGRTKIRRISDPNKPMRRVHAELIRALRCLPANLRSATGALKGHSPMSNIAPHRNNRYFFLVDIKSAYESVDNDKLVDVLLDLDPSIPRELIGSAVLSSFMEAFCLNEKGGLLTGAPASPQLYNIYVGMLVDGLVQELCKQYSLTYTRYLDDLTFSSRARIGSRKRKALLSTIRQAGFVIHDSKTQLRDLKRGAIKITGLMLNWGGRVTLPRSYTRRLQGFLYDALRKNLVDLKTRRKVNGMMAQLYFSLSYPRRPGGERRRRQPNATEQRVIDLHRDYKRIAIFGPPASDQSQDKPKKKKR